MLPYLVLVVACGSAVGELAVDARFPGGNVVVEKIDGDTVWLRQDERDTPAFWFYWSFRVTGGAGRTVTFQFTKGNVFGPRGPAVSTDGGQTWRWLGLEAVQENSFAWRFADDARDVQFCFAVPYVEEHWRAFLKKFGGNEHLFRERLTRTAKGRAVELVRFGRIDGSADRRVLLTARHHACEMMANYVLEGVIAATLADDDDARWLRGHVEFVAVPFVDKDGVEDGDQGKLRAPYDHWLDYREDSRYASVAALRQRFEQEPRPKVDVALDIHCPAMRDEQIYFATSPDPRIAAQAMRLSELLEQHQRGPLKHDPKHNQPFGKGWNVASTYEGRKSFHLWAEELNGIQAAATLEVPYATVNGAEVTPDSARRFGHDLALVLRLYLDQGPGGPLKKGTVPLGRIDMSRENQLSERGSPLFQQAPGAAGARANAATDSSQHAAAEKNSPRNHWAYRPVAPAPIPAVHGAVQPRTEIDSFLLARLESAGLTPAALADRQTLIRRLYFDLAGLPPPSEAVDDFVGDTRLEAWERLVDRLLESPAFGERQARRWLDVVRFAESVTLRGLVFREAWRYRDWVIDALNRDLPYDRFLRVQIAGNLLPADSLEDRQRQLIATTVLQLGNTNFEEQDKKQLEMDVVDEQLDLIGRGFLGQTLGCARCHDHKFDPITTREYYSLAGILRNSKSLEHENVSRWVEVPLPLDADMEAFFQRREQEIKAAQKNLDEARAALKQATDSKAEEGEALARLRDDAQRLESELRERKAQGPPRPMVMTVVDVPQPADLNVQLRGNVHHPGELAPRGFLEVASGGSAGAAISTGEGGRRQLAQWISSPENPLTARVFVNRVWHWLFGAGLVRTTDNFGTTGEAPSHPELLDHLAATFMKDGWSVKRLFRRIVLSRTYQQSVAADAAARVRDPENRLLGRMNRRPLDAECLRDALLAVSGNLRLERGGPGFPRDLAADYGFNDLSNRRSVYLPVFRNALPELFETFDFADPGTVSGQRGTSAVAPQALYLVNSPFVISQAQSAATRILNESWPDDNRRIARIWRLALGRQPSAEERQAAEKFLAMSAADDAGGLEARWARLIQAVFATLDFRYVQ